MTNEKVTVTLSDLRGDDNLRANLLADDPVFLPHRKLKIITGSPASTINDCLGFNLKATINNQARSVNLIELL